MGWLQRLYGSMAHGAHSRTEKAGGGVADDGRPLPPRQAAEAARDALLLLMLLAAEELEEAMGPAKTHEESDGRSHTPWVHGAATPSGVASPRRTDFRGEDALSAPSVAADGDCLPSEPANGAQSTARGGGPRAAPPPRFRGSYREREGASPSDAAGPASGGPTGAELDAASLAALEREHERAHTARRVQVGADLDRALGSLRAALFGGGADGHGGVRPPTTVEAAAEAATALASGGRHPGLSAERGEDVGDGRASEAGGLLGARTGAGAGAGGPSPPGGLAGRRSSAAATTGDLAGLESARAERQSRVEGSDARPPATGTERRRRRPSLGHHPAAAAANDPHHPEDDVLPHTDIDDAWLGAWERDTGGVLPSFLHLVPAALPLLTHEHRRDAAAVWGACARMSETTPPCRGAKELARCPEVLDGLLSWCELGDPRTAERGPHAWGMGIGAGERGGGGRGRATGGACGGSPVPPSSRRLSGVGDREARGDRDRDRGGLHHPAPPACDFDAHGVPVLPPLPPPGAAEGASLALAAGAMIRDALRAPPSCHGGPPIARALVQRTAGFWRLFSLLDGPAFEARAHSFTLCLSLPLLTEAPTSTQPPTHPPTLPPSLGPSYPPIDPDLDPEGGVGRV